MEKKVLNPFVQESEGRRYDLYRPHYHDLPFSILKTQIPPVDFALDVACGTGHSTISLSKIVQKVVGIDLSPAMLEEARKRPNLEFIQGPAENLPFPNQHFNLVHVSMAIQWFDQARFLEEAKRVLRKDGLLTIDNYGFTGKMQGHDTFLDQYKKFDQTYFPPAPRNKNFPDEETMKDHGLQLHLKIPYDHWVEMTSHQFSQYLMTRSNFLQLNSDDQLNMANRVEDFYEKIFFGQSQKLLFSGLLKVYQRCQA